MVGKETVLPVWEGGREGRNREERKKGERKELTIAECGRKRTILKRTICKNKLSTTASQEVKKFLVTFSSNCYIF